MTDSRYVCMKCRTAHHEPGICPACGYPDLLDMNIPSERELLGSTSKRSIWGAVALLLIGCVVIGGVFGLIVPYGTHWVAQNWLSLGDRYAEALAVAAPLVLLLGTIIVSTIMQPAHSDSVEISEQDRAQWQALLDEPVPFSEEEDAAMARRRAARRASRRKL